MEIILTFNEQLNISLQKGDTIWYLKTNAVGGYDVAKSSFAKKLGVVKEINNQNNEIVVDSDINDPTLNLQDIFVMFSKDSIANKSSLIGYYAEVFLENNSKEKIELFAVNSEVAQSSK